MNGSKTFFSGGDQALRTSNGYSDYENIGRLNVLDLQVQIRRLPKPVIAMSSGSVNKNYGSNDRSGEKDNGSCDKKLNNSDAKVNQLLDSSLIVDAVVAS
ncbi:hypothetical protein Lal_00036659 [Lupinus albus]|nr:hypothetical protein Lal_00036659 [Lupinus albus]